MNTTSKLLLGIVLVAVVAGGGWWAFSSQSGDDLSKLSASVGEKLTDAQVQAVVARISKFMVVPENEKPSVIVLKDVASLAQQQPFYRGAADGQILIVYSTRAIIYDAKTNKLVSVSPITQNTATPVPSVVASGSAQLTPTPSASTAPIAPEKITLEVRNGTSTAGLAGKTASELDAKYSWITSPKAADAKNSYKTTVIVDLSKGTKPGAVAALETYFGVTSVTELPKGEVATTADILVIVGK